MPFENSPNPNMKYNFAIKAKNVILNKNKSPLLFEDLKKLSLLNKIDFFSETIFNFTCLELDENQTIPNSYIEIPLREFFSIFSKEESAVAARARTLSKWRNSMQFCPKCGTKLLFCKDFTAKECPNCSAQYFPRIEPAVIVLISKEDKILLAKHSQRDQNVYTCLAGFIEAGETAEQAVEREVFEETGIKIKNLKYKGSQGWPYPDQLMLAYTADYASGELLIQKEELEDAAWFSRANLPQIPKAGSVAYRLINNLF